MIRFNCPHCNRPYELPPALAFLPLVCKQCGQRITPPTNTPDAPAPLSPPKPLVPVAPPKPAIPVAKIVSPPSAKAAAPVAIPPAPPVAPPTTAKPSTPGDEDKDEGVRVTKPDTTRDPDSNVGGPPAASLSDANRPKPAGLSDANRPRPTELDNATEPEINLELLGPEPPPRVKRSPKFPEPETPPETRPEPTLMPFLADLVVFVALVAIGMFVGEQLTGKNTGTVLSEAGSATTFPPTDLLLWGGPPAMFGLIYLLLSARKSTVGEWLRRRATK